MEKIWLKKKSLKYITEVFPQGEVKTQIRISCNWALTFLVPHATLERNKISIIFWYQPKKEQKQQANSLAVL